jgi:uncharacterized protein YjbI with pentapeptide repeats
MGANLEEQTQTILSLEGANLEGVNFIKANLEGVKYQNE